MNQDKEYNTIHDYGACDHCGKVSMVAILLEIERNGNKVEETPIRALCRDCQGH